MKRNEAETKLNSLQLPNLSMDVHLVTALIPPWQTPRSFSVHVSSTDYVSQDTSHRRCKFLSPLSYNLVFCMPNFYTEEDSRNYQYS
jgi:hypothetical protein